MPPHCRYLILYVESVCADPAKWALWRCNQGVVDPRHIYEQLSTIKYVSKVTKLICPVTAPSPSFVSRLLHVEEDARPITSIGLGYFPEGHHARYSSIHQSVYCADCCFDPSAIAPSLYIPAPCIVLCPSKKHLRSQGHHSVTGRGWVCPQDRIEGLAHWRPPRANRMNTWKLVC